MNSNFKVLGNPRSNKNSHDILIDIDVEGYGTIVFCASPTDTEEYGRNLYKRAKEGEFGNIAIATSENCIWDGEKWVEPILSLEEIIAAKVAEINNARDLELVAGLEYDGNIYDSDDKSIQRINGLVTQTLLDPMFSTNYITKDNKTVVLNAQKLVELGRAASQHESNAVFKARQLKDQLLAATSTKEVEVIQW